ncbi:MAG: hypothetical protein AB7V50_02525 [Vampirovibrionia bacterium]
MMPFELNNTTPSQYVALIERLKNLPLWVRQAIFSDLKDSIPEYKQMSISYELENKLAQLYVPKLTAIGSKIIAQGGILSTDNDLETKHKLFLTAVHNNMNLLEISHKSRWSFRFTCEVFIELLERAMVCSVENAYIYSQILYIIDRISLGQYFVKTNKITQKDLDRAIFAKKCSDDMGGDTSFEEILINLSLISSSDIDPIKAIKESINFVVEVIDPVEVQADEIMYLQSEIESLKLQQEKLEKKMDFYKQELEEMHQENIELTKELNKHAKGIPGQVFATFN